RQRLEGGNVYRVDLRLPLLRGCWNDVPGWSERRRDQLLHLRADGLGHRNRSCQYLAWRLRCCRCRRSQRNGGTSGAKRETNIQTRPRLHGRPTEVVVESSCRRSCNWCRWCSRSLAATRARENERCVSKRLLD